MNRRQCTSLQYKRTHVHTPNTTSSQKSTQN